ncbi:MAG: phosphodiester glycosidase family protein [Prochlorothrix sp.]
MTDRLRFPPLRWPWLLVAIALFLPLGAYGIASLRRPAPLDRPPTPLFQGITYQRWHRDRPQPYQVHIVAIDLQAPGLSPRVTPGERAPRAPLTAASPPNYPFAARTTSAFAQEFQVQVAINAGFFFPFRDNTPWNYVPRPGDAVQVLLGQSIAQGQVDSVQWGQRQFPVLCFKRHQGHYRAEILGEGVCDPDTEQAVAGITLLDPKNPPRRAGRRYGRTAVAIDATGDRLWLIVVDGKQRHYSEGATLQELAVIIGDLGGEIGINLDGGGSSTLVAQVSTARGMIYRLLNAPIHTKWPRRERPVANHLGIYAQPLP